MIDLLQKALNSPVKSVSKEQFNRWKHDSVTESLFQALTLSVLEQFEDSLPEDPQTGLAVAYKRDGARVLLDILFEWEPEIGEQDDD